MPFTIEYFDPCQIEQVELKDIVQLGSQQFFIQTSRWYGESVTLSVGDDTKEFVSFENSPKKYGIIPVEHHDELGECHEWAGVFEACFMDPFFPSVKAFEREKTLIELQQEGFLLVGKVIWKKSHTNNGLQKTPKNCEEN